MPSRQINDFFTKRKQKRIELVARPDVAIFCAPQEAIDVEDGLFRKPQVDGQRDLTFHLGMIQHLLKANVYQALVDPEIVWLFSSIRLLIKTTRNGEYRKL